MHHAVTVIDNFLPDPQQVREYALSHKFEGVQMDGHTYPGTEVPRNPQFKVWLERLLSQAVLAQVQILKHAFVTSKEGEFTEQWIHADSICATHGAVVYLFDGHHKHGTAFWRHLESDKTEMNQEFYDALGVDVKDEEQVKNLVAKIKTEGEDQSFWELAGFSEAKLGRLIFFNSRLFHSRYPREAFGHDLESSRLILVIFFNIAP